MSKNTKKTVTPEEYGAFVAGLQLDSVYMTSSSSVRNREPDVSNGAKLKYGFNSKVLKFIKSDLGFISTVKYDVDMYDDSSDEPFCTIKTTWALEYTSDIQINDKIYSIFKDRNVPLNAWPYFREFVHSSTLRMHLPALVLPVYKV